MSRFVRVPHDFLRHPAFMTASGNEKGVLLELWARHNGKNNGDLSLSFREARALIGLGQVAFATALNGLQSRGLIVRTSEGQFLGRLAATWRLTMTADKGSQPTNEYLAWTSEPRIDHQYASYGPSIRKRAHGTGHQYANGPRLVLAINTPLESLTRTRAIPKEVRK